MHLIYRFIPERWLRENAATKIHPFSNVQFGHGPRMCIGKRFTDLQAQMLVATLVKRYRIEWAGREPLGTVFKLNYMPDRPVDLRLVPR